MLLLPTFEPGSEFDAVGVVYAMGSALSYAFFWRRSQRLTRQLGPVQLAGFLVVMAGMAWLKAPRSRSAVQASGRVVENAPRSSSRSSHSLSPGSAPRQSTSGMRKLR